MMATNPSDTSATSGARSDGREDAARKLVRPIGARDYFAEQALLPTGFASAVRFVIGEDGHFVSVTPGASSDGAERLAGPVLPGLVNLHSHSFQRAMAGLTSSGGGSGGGGAGAADNFWSWRQVMYRFLALLGPDDIEAIAAQLYVELLCAGFTTVAEFHYLHHDPDGRPYENPAELGLRHLAAAERTGIALTLLPVLYAHSNFGGADPLPSQRRFLLDPDAYSLLLQSLKPEVAARPRLRLGVAPHSLRAVTIPELRAAVTIAERLGPSTPIHLHIAEQEAEVESCLLFSSQRPVAWLLDQIDVDRRFCLVHATHMDKSECERLSRTGAVAGLCPTTEADLGDGLFDASRYLSHGGRFGIGTDSHVSVDPFEELRLLEYGQRLLRKRRNVLIGSPGESVAGTLFRAVASGGAQAAAQPTSVLAAGARADLVVLDGELEELGSRSGDGILDAAVFGPRRGLVRDVLVGGEWVVRERVHKQAAPILAAYKAVLRRLLSRAP